MQRSYTRSINYGTYLMEYVLVSYTYTFEQLQQWDQLKHYQIHGYNPTSAWVTRKTVVKFGYHHIMLNCCSSSCIRHLPDQRHLWKEPGSLELESDFTTEHTRRVSHQHLKQSQIEIHCQVCPCQNDHISSTRSDICLSSFGLNSSFKDKLDQKCICKQIEEAYLE